jgi:signal transduction histidine kinase
MSLTAFRPTVGALLDRRVAAVAAVVAISFLVLFGWLTYQSTRNRIIISMENLVEVTAKSIENELATIDRHLAILGSDIQIREGEVDLTQVRPLLRRFREHLPSVNPVNVTRADGRIVATTQTESATLPSLARLPSFQLAIADLKAKREVSISRPFLGLVTGEWLIAIRRALRDDAGEVLYTVGAGLPLNRLESRWSQAKLPPNTAIGLVRDDGYLTSRYPPAPGESLEKLYGRAIAEPLRSHLSSHPAQQSGVIEGASQTLGRGDIFAFRRIPQFAQTVFILVPTDMVLSYWWSDTRYFLLLFVVYFALAWLMYLVARRHRDHLEMQRIEHVAALESANRELEAFSYTVSHDLRAPLRTIDGFGNLIADDEGSSLSADGRNYLQRMRQASRRLGDLIDALLAVARHAREPLKLEALDMREKVRSIVDDIKVAGVKAEFVIDDLPPCRADRALIRAVWVNLLSNAVKYSGNVESPRVEVGYENGRYYVRDNGVGFDMRHADQLFGVFQRLHSRAEFEGIGIGLATVDRIVRRHGGEVFASGELGKGATFGFTIGRTAG